MEKSLLTRTMTFETFGKHQNQRTVTILSLIKEGKLKMLHSYVKQQQIKYEDEKKKNLLSYAAFYLQPQILLYLLMRGIPLNDLDSENRNIFHVCAYSASYKCAVTIVAYLKLLREMELSRAFRQALSKYNFKRTDYKQGELIITASESKKERFKEFKSACKHIIQNYYDTQLQDFVVSLSTQDNIYKRTPIHLVSLNKFNKCFATLKVFTKVDDVDENSNFLEMWFYAEELLETGIDPRIYKNTLKEISTSLPTREYESIIKKYKEKFDMQIAKILCIRDKQEYTALHLASYQGDSNIVKLLISLGADPKDIDSKSKGGKIIEYATNDSVRKQITDLCKASEEGDKNSVNLLLNCGQQVNEKSTIFGVTPLFKSIAYSSEKHNYETTNILLDSGAEINISDVNGWTSMHKACQIGDLQLIQLLLDKKASVTKPSNKGYYPLHIAALNNKSKVIQLLVKYVKDLDLNVEDNLGCRPLHLAARKGGEESIIALLDAGADIYAIDRQKWTALHHATFGEHKKCIKLLLKYDADEDKLRRIENCQGKVAKQLSNNGNIRSSFSNIWRAAYEGNLDFIRKEILSGADKDEQTIEKKRTALMYAVLGGHYIVVKYLVQQEVNMYLEDFAGKTAEDYAKEYLKGVIAKKLKKQRVQAQKIVKVISSQ